MRRFSFCLIILLLPVLLFAYNAQKVIPLESDVYSAIDSLYLLEGKAVASTTRPWTVAETEMILSKVSEQTSPELYAIVEKAIGEKGRLSVDEMFDMSFKALVSVTGYAHTDTDFVYPFNGMTNYLFKTANERPTLQASWEAWAGNHIYSYVWYQYKNDFNKEKFSSYHFNFDIANLTPEGFTSDINQREPSRAFAVVGGKGWSLEIGRDRLLMGAGVTGSLIMSDSLPYHNILRFSAFGSKYKYTYMMSFLQHMKDDRKGILFYMTHRLECRFLSDRLYAAVNESIMYKNDNGFMDLRYVNPVMYFHNYFISDLANSIVDLEISHSFARGWNLYTQIAIDQFTTSWEVADGDDTDPLAMGFLMGLRYVTCVQKGVLTLNLEGAYTMPYLYLRATNIPEGSHVQDPEDPGLGYIGLYRGSRFFLGYTYGGDAVVIDLKASYSVPGDWEAGAELMFMNHGEKNASSLFDKDDDSYAPSGQESHYIMIELAGKKHFDKDISVYFQYDLVLGDARDNQFVLGVEKRF
ncbi:MAG: hypothetical protein IJT86_03075 [Spirochaetales bacterium]|nr:hypothetical protein [Spirochaetales bacterium]